MNWRQRRATGVALLYLAVFLLGVGVGATVYKALVGPPIEARETEQEV